MCIDLLIFDLDGTLYDESCGYVEEVHKNIFRFMVEQNGGKFDDISTISQAQAAWKPIFDKYNLTKRGLLGEGYEFDSLQYDQYIRKGADKYITHDLDLRVFLESLPQRKVIFTNAPESSANEILELLGVADLFEHVLGTEFLRNKVCKPERKSFEMMLNFLGVHNLEQRSRVCYFEDSFKNLIAGKNEWGFKTVFVKGPTMSTEGHSEEELSQFDAVVHVKVGVALRESMPSLWQ